MTLAFKIISLAQLRSACLPGLFKWDVLECDFFAGSDGACREELHGVRFQVPCPFGARATTGIVLMVIAISRLVASVNVPVIASRDV